MSLFPKSFVFGIAESDLQTVGYSLPVQNEAAQHPMWESFAKSKKNDTPEFGSYKYDNIKTDTQLIGKLGVKAYRTSVSMSRTIDKDGNVNKKAIQWYRSYFKKLKAQGLEIHLCLYHWEAPEKFAKKGILHPQFQEYFLKHTDIVLEELSDLADYILPINEIWCMSFLAYYIGIHAPGYSDISKYFESYFACIELQTKVIQRIKEHDKNHKIGIVNIHFPSYIRPEHSGNKAYIKTRHLADNVTNYIYTDPFFMGTIDKEIIKTFKSYFPANWKEIITNAQCADQIDYYGVNYYNSQYVKPSKKDIGYELDEEDTDLKNSLGWPVAIAPYYPNGLTDILVAFNNRYASYGLKNLVVSENGTPCYSNPKETTPQDNFRIFFINEHLLQIQDALTKGAPVTGYFLWTLTDNYEWQEGYKPESAFGLVAVDSTGKRTPKKSYYWYQNFIKDFYSQS